MKVSVDWLKAYVDFDLPTEELARRMVMAGNGVEGIDKADDLFGRVVVGRVLTCAPHPNSDHLHVTTVDVGGDAPLQIVCGAPNVRAGGLYPVFLVGSKLPDGHVIGKGKLRGVDSFGMLASGPELGIPDGLYPNIGDAGLLEFTEDYAPGTDVKEIFGLSDVLDFEVLANRPDCLSVWGLARECAAVLDAHFTEPIIEFAETGAGTFGDYAKVSVLDNALCPRYCAKVIRNVRLGRSPKWLRAYLHGAGVRPINNIVDITNYVMLETGHPMHAFDLDKVRDRQIVVRRARPDETLVTLDGKTHPLSDRMLVIADADRATGLAGIMGGEESEITDATRNVLFECAAFDRTATRLTARALGIRTESSGRFEKGVTPRTAKQALLRACMLVEMLDCGDIVPGLFDHYPSALPPVVVKASVARINERISADLSGEAMQDLLTRLFFDVTLDGDSLTAIVPDFRQDVEQEADLAEEILRLYGYEHIPSTLMTGVTMAGRRSEKQVVADRVKAALIGMGWFEAMNYSFISPKWLDLLQLPEGDARLDPVRIRNPLGEDTSVMRTSLVPSMLNTLATNWNRGAESARLFEYAPVFEKTDALPNENPTLLLGMFGKQADFFQLKGELFNVLSRFGIEPRVAPGGDPYYHPGRKAQLLCDKRQIGQLGEIHPDVAQAFGVDGARLYVAELDMRAVMALQNNVRKTAVLPRFPAVTRDLALVMDEGLYVAPVIETIRAASGASLEKVTVFDVFRGVQLGLGKKSVAFALSFRAPDRTLTEPEITALIDAILAAVQAKHGATRRA